MDCAIKKIYYQFGRGLKMDEEQIARHGIYLIIIFF